MCKTEDTYDTVGNNLSPSTENNSSEDDCKQTCNNSKDGDYLDCVAFVMASNNNKCWFIKKDSTSDYFPLQGFGYTSCFQKVLYKPLQ